MKIKIDENLPLTLATLLIEMGHDALTTRDEGLTGAADPRVWQAAQREERFLITQDLDFSDTRRFIPGTHHGLLLLRLRSPGRRGLLQRAQAVFKTEDVDRWAGCFVIATERKVRVRRPLKT